MKKQNPVPNALPKLDFNVTNRCNFRCIHCCFRSGESIFEEFSLEKIAEVLAEFKRLGGQRIDVTGGEPLMRNDVEEIIRIGKSLGLKIELVTNGSLLTVEKMRAFKRLGLDAIAISLDGSHHDIYRKIRPVSRGVYDRVVSNIGKCAAMGFYTKVNTVVFNSNFDDLADITRLCVKLGASEQGFYYFTPVGRGATSPGEVADPQKWLRLVRQKLAPMRTAIKLSIETPILENALAKDLNASCYLENPWHLQILPDGKVYPCAIMAFYGRPCGDLYSQTLREIWIDKNLWNGGYFRKNVAPLFKKYGACVAFRHSLKGLIASGDYKFLCLMCKLKAKNFYGRGQEK